MICSIILCIEGVWFLISSKLLHILLVCEIIYDFKYKLPTIMIQQIKRKLILWYTSGLLFWFHCEYLATIQRGEFLKTGEFPMCLLNKQDTVLRIGVELLSHCPLVRSSVLLPAGVNITSIYLSWKMNHIVLSHHGEEIWYYFWRGTK